MHGLTIGRVAKATNCKVQTIRYYEQIGLLQEPPRSEGNQRLYDESAIKRLSFIRHCRDLGFPLNAVRDLLRLSDSPDQPCHQADEIVIEQLNDIKQRIRQLNKLKNEMERMLDHCHGSTSSDCRVIEVLSDHSLCSSKDHKV